MIPAELANYISTENLKELIGEALPVFLKWHTGQTYSVYGNQKWYPMADYQNWLKGGKITD